jgi:hypothetical protein
MTVLFRIPEEANLGPRSKKNFLITGGAIQAIKSVAFNISLGDIETEEAIGKSVYGTPVMDRLEIPEGDYIDLDGNTISFPGIVINTIVFEASKSKNIVKTAIQGRNGKVKEYVSDDDFLINARGFISNKDNAIPLDDLRNFREIMEVPQQISVISQYLNEILEVNEIVIENFSMPQIEGVRNEIPFTFQASSDVPIDLEELE